MSEKRKEIINSATPEMMGPGEGLPVFFNWAEKTHPQGVKELVNVIGSLMPKSDRAVTEEEIREGLTDSGLNQGFSLLSYWLEKITGNGFRKVGWLEGEALTRGASAMKGINLPAKRKSCRRRDSGGFEIVFSHYEKGGSRRDEADSDSREFIARVGRIKVDK